MYSTSKRPMGLIAGFFLACAAPLISFGADSRPARWIPLDGATLLDSRSGLQWTRSDNGHDIDWHRAGRFCDTLPGKWRLPTEDELGSIYENTAAAGARCGTSRCRISGPFELTGDWFWSADSVGNDGSDGVELAWGVLMVNGTRTKSVKEAGDGSRALCVRKSRGSKPSQPAQESSTVVTLPIDQSHTAVIFSWTHHGFSHPVARLEQVSGTLTWDRSDLVGSSVQVTLPLEGLRTGDDALNRRLRGHDFFDAAAYPLITFKSTEIVQKTGTNEFTVIGELTVHGVTQPVALLAKINQVEEPPGLRTGFDADGTLRRSDFGLSRYVPMVGDEITIHITLEAHPE